MKSIRIGIVSKASAFSQAPANLKRTAFIEFHQKSLVSSQRPDEFKGLYNKRWGVEGFYSIA